MTAETGQTTSRLLNRLAYDMANKAADVTTATTSDLIPIIDVSDDYEVKYADSANVFELMGITASAAELNAAADNSASTRLVAAAGSAVTALTGGGTYLIPLVTANVTMTLPATPTLGEKHRFVFTGTAADAEDWVLTAAAFFVGGLGFFDVGGTNAAVYANGTTHNTLTINNPAAGTDFTVIGDGTNWAIAGYASSADAPAFSAV
jgi:hypothetical protein